MAAFVRSSKVKVTASSSRSPAPATRWHARWRCSARPLAPIRLRIGVNTGEIQLRDEGNYIGPTINRTARLRDLGHGGQTLLSGATESMVLDHLPEDAWLNDLGAHPLRDLPRPERVVQLCHPDIRNDFPPLRTSESETAQRLPTQLTSFVGREGQIAEVRGLLADNRLVTLTGAGGSGKTRLAIQVASEFGDGVRYVDLAPITDAESRHRRRCPRARASGPAGPIEVDTVVRFIGEPSTADGAGQLRASARCQRGTHRRTSARRAQA